MMHKFFSSKVSSKIFFHYKPMFKFIFSINANYPIPFMDCSTTPTWMFIKNKVFMCAFQRTKWGFSMISSRATSPYLSRAICAINIFPIPSVIKTAAMGTVSGSFYSCVKRYSTIETIPKINRFCKLTIKTIFDRLFYRHATSIVYNY